ncbi:hypothetical protein LSAT2_013866 [Lamellibrachia satsuma]|nr:hypothetical protein LSAT2_013866 [Lamellibrachia satsuma]
MLQFRNACKQDSKSFQISRESSESAATTGNRLCGVASGRQKKGELNCEWRRESPRARQSLIECLSSLTHNVLT